MTQKSRYFLIASAAVLILALGGGLMAYLAHQRTAGGPAGVPPEVRYVPVDAAIVAYANVRAVMDSELRRQLAPTIETGDPPRQGRHMMNDVAGVDLEKQVDHVLAYVERSETPAAPPAETRTAPRAVALVSGSFEQARVEQFIREHGGTIEDYHGHRMSVQQHGSEEIAIGFVGRNLIAVGQADLVRRVLDRPVDASEPAKTLAGNAEMMSLIRDASGSTAWVVGHFDAMSRGISLPSAMRGNVPLVRLMSAKADLNGGVRVSVRADAADESAAEQLREVVRGFVSLARLQSGARPEFDSALKSIQLSGSGSVVEVTFTMPLETVRALTPQRGGPTEPRRGAPPPPPQ